MIRFEPSTDWMAEDDAGVPAQDEADQLSWDTAQTDSAEVKKINELLQSADEAINRECLHELYRMTHS